MIPGAPGAPVVRPRAAIQADETPGALAAADVPLHEEAPAAAPLGAVAPIRYNAALAEAFALEPRDFAAQAASADLPVRSPDAGCRLHSGAELPVAASDRPVGPLG